MPMTAEQKRLKRAADRAARETEAKDGVASDRPTEIQKLSEAAIKRPDLVASGNVATPSSGGAKVTVALKLGVAFFDIQICKIEEKFEQNMQGGRMVKEATRVGPRVRLRGTAYPRGTVPEGFPDRPRMAGGAALNPGIDKDFWDTWVEQNRLNPLVVNGMIFAHEIEDHVVGQAKEVALIHSGLEPVDPRDRKDNRVPRSTRGDITNIETEESRAKKQAHVSGGA
jgi:hypothetical protein